MPEKRRADEVTTVLHTPSRENAKTYISQQDELFHCTLCYLENFIEILECVVKSAAIW